MTNILSPKRPEKLDVKWNNIFVDSAVNSWIYEVHEAERF
jgi:hypothetical protein